jgi:hypothetical protein
MIDFSTLKFGDKLYNVVYNLQAFQRKKISTMIDGVEWFRYDQPIRGYDIVEYTYVGRADTHISGEVIPDDVDDAKYFIRESNGALIYLHHSDADDDDWFASKEEAKKEVNERIEDDKRIDRS